jgi:hypothetical protein
VERGVDAEVTPSASSDERSGRRRTDEGESFDEPTPRGRGRATTGSMRDRIEPLEPGGSSGSDRQLRSAERNPRRQRLDRGDERSAKLLVCAAGAGAVSGEPFAWRR